tara:strand:+ start:274 stop:495 length:222 start_codon:yes stop_codon:yes gene_type:complete
MSDIAHITNTMTGVKIVNMKELKDSMEVIKYHLTIKEADDLTEVIMKDIERKLNLSNSQVLDNIEEQLHETYK